MTTDDNINIALKILNNHYADFFKNKLFADPYGQPNPCDTRAWSQILISALANLSGLGRKKGADFNDGSDVKAANCWDAIDTPRFNGCIKSGTKASTADSCASLATMPYLFFVLWDTAQTQEKRCRVWVVRTSSDVLFREIAGRWYTARSNGEITSSNFQLHPPRNLDKNIFSNNCGTLEYPLLLDARYDNKNKSYYIYSYDPSVMMTGSCKRP